MDTKDAGCWNSAEVMENATQASLGNEPHSRTQVPVGTCYPKMQSIYTVMAEQREQEYQDQLRQQAVYRDHSQQQGSEFVTVDHIHQQESSCHAEDYMTWSVFSMLFTCLCIGLGAFHYSRETRVYSKQGDVKKARENSYYAMWCNIAALLTGIAITVTIVVLRLLHYF